MSKKPHIQVVRSDSGRRVYYIDIGHLSYREKKRCIEQVRAEMTKRRRPGA